MATEVLENVLYFYDKNMNLIAIFDDDQINASESAMRNMVAAPIVHIEQNGASYVTFQMLANSTKFQQIKDPETVLYLNGRYYTALNDGAFKYGGEGNIRVVTCTYVETWYKLDKKYNQAYNTSLYVYAKATFQRLVADGAVFKIDYNGCSNPGNTITKANAWSQVKLWRVRDDSNNQLHYSILKSEDYAPTNWENAPSAVAFSSFVVTGNSATVIIKPIAKTDVQQNFEYDTNNSYQIEGTPYPNTLKNVYVNSTIITTTSNTKKYTTSNKPAKFSYNNTNGKFSLNYTLGKDETINYIIVVYEKSDIGTLSPGATCTFAFGAEVVDEHTVLILPKSDWRYKLTIDGVEYDDSQVKDGRGVVMPRGSAGYAMWAVLKNSGWSLGICDVLPKGFDASIDYGSFNIESDQKDVLYNIQYIQQLYGGILDWDSKNKILNYRAENNIDYQVYNDGFNDWTGYEFREGKNMRDQPEVTYDNDIITRAYLLGYGGLNVTKVNNGKTYVDDFSFAKDIYEGYLEQPLIYDTNDEGGMKQLLFWGKRELSKKCKPRKTIHINANDIRTVEQGGILYSHEVFKLNDVVRVYSRESDSDVETYEEKRITLWEYNAFALWDSTVELGDKTQNFSELFKLIYNKSVIDAPKTNASGQISSDEIIMEFDNSDFAWDLIDISGFSGGYGSYSYGGGGYGYGSTLSDYLSLIVQKTTDNSDAIAGLTMEATELYSQAELFATYQKQTDEKISETYAGLVIYADDKTSSLQAVVQGNYQLTQKAIDQARKDARDDYIQLRSYTDAGFDAQQDENKAFARQLSQFDGELYNFKQDLQKTVKSVAQCVTYADANIAYAKLSADYNSQIRDTQKTLTQYASQAAITAEANAKQAMTQQLSSYATTSYVDGQLKTKASVASVTTLANDVQAVVTLKATVDNIGSALSLSNTSTVLKVMNNTNATAITVNPTTVNISATNGITLNGVTSTSNTSVSIQGNVVKWRQIYCYASNTATLRQPYWVLGRN